MSVILKTKAVGPWPMNTYLVICDETQASAIIDPGADAGKILDMAVGTHVESILITHGDFDHVGALAEIKLNTSAPVYLHPADAEFFDLNFDQPLVDGQVLQIGSQRLRAIHTPGHTPGEMCFDLGDGRVVVGDTVFVGGPGRTSSADNFSITMRTMQKIVFTWPDETVFYPGHGPSGVIGEERPAFEAFVARGWSKDLYGDVTWG